MYLQRKVDRFLAQWHAADDRKPLVIKGPRQVGKTESIRRFAKRHYENVVEINFVEEPKYRAITSDGYGVQDVPSLPLLGRGQGKGEVQPPFLSHPAHSVLSATSGPQGAHSPWRSGIRRPG